MLDGHIHIMDATQGRTELLARMRQAGMDGGVLISLPPASFPIAAGPKAAPERLANLMEWCRADAGLIPAFWIDPTEEDASDQVQKAVSAGVAAFKVICSRFYPGDRRAMPIYRQIAQTGKPILFHSGILWDGQDSSRYNRPAEFEAMLDVPGLRFSMAHISWPWCDECLAVFGKLQDACRHRKTPMPMFIDTTPGTPKIYRKEVLTKLFTIGYDVRRNVFFGSDCVTGDYQPAYAAQWSQTDKTILTDLGIPNEDIDNVFGGNLRRFLSGE